MNIKTETTTVRAAILIAALAVLAACGNSTTPSAGTAASAPPNSVKGAPEQGEQLKHPTARSRALVGGARSLPWSVVSNAGRTLKIAVKSGGCAEFDRVVVDEADDSVMIAGLAKPRRAGDDACNAVATENFATLKLGQPMGERRLLHAPITPRWDGLGVTPS